MTERDEQLLAAVSVAADRRRLERVTRRALDRGGPVADMLRKLAANDREAWKAATEILDRLGGNKFNLLDIAVEVTQLELVAAGEPRTWVWPGAANG